MSGQYVEEECKTIFSGQFVGEGQLARKIGAAKRRATVNNRINEDLLAKELSRIRYVFWGPESQAVKTQMERIAGKHLGRRHRYLTKHLIDHALFKSWSF